MATSVSPHPLPVQWPALGELGLPQSALSQPPHPFLYNGQPWENYGHLSQPSSFTCTMASPGRTMATSVSPHPLPVQWPALGELWLPQSALILYLYNGQPWENYGCLSQPSSFTCTMASPGRTMAASVSPHPLPVQWPALGELWLPQSALILYLYNGQPWENYGLLSQPSSFTCTMASPGRTMAASVSPHPLPVLWPALGELWPPQSALILYLYNGQPWENYGRLSQPSSFTCTMASPGRTMAASVSPHPLPVQWPALGELWLPQSALILYLYNGQPWENYGHLSQPSSFTCTMASPGRTMAASVSPHPLPVQ